jgi:hypothetical protein
MWGILTCKAWCRESIANLVSQYLVFFAFLLQPSLIQAQESIKWNKVLPG